MCACRTLNKLEFYKLGPASAIHVDRERLSCFVAPNFESFVVDLQVVTFLTLSMPILHTCLRNPTSTYSETDAECQKSRYYGYLVRVQNN